MTPALWLRMVVKLGAWIVGTIADVFALPVFIVIYVGLAVVAACRDWWHDVGFVRRSLDT